MRSGKRCVEFITSILSYNTYRSPKGHQSHITNSSIKGTSSRILIELNVSVLGTEASGGGGSTEMSAPKLRGQRGNRPDVPNNQLPIHPCRSDFIDRPVRSLVRPHARDGVLVHRKQLRFSLRTPTTGPGAGDTPRICVLEGIKGCAVQLPRPTRAEFGRTKSGFGSRCVVEASDQLPSTFVSGEDVRLAIVTSSNDGVLGGPYEGDERESGYSDRTDCGTRSRIDDADGAVMTFASVLSFMSAKMNKKKGLPANARTSPDGEKETV